MCAKVNTGAGLFLAAEPERREAEMIRFPIVNVIANGIKCCSSVLGVREMNGCRIGKQEEEEEESITVKALPLGKHHNTSGENLIMIKAFGLPCYKAWEASHDYFFYLLTSDFLSGLVWITADGVADEIYCISYWRVCPDCSNNQ